MNILSKENHLPVFPLNTVVFINGVLQLQIFEQRYLNMIKSCMTKQHGFIAALIRSGKEVNDTPDVFQVGTLVDIIDWNQLDNNLLGITIQGRQRVNINNTLIQSDNLITADIDFIDNIKAYDADVIDEDLLSLLHTLHKHPFVSAKYPDINDTSVVNVVYKLCELLPASNHEKQKLLEAQQFRSLLDQLKTIINRLENLNSFNESS